MSRHETGNMHPGSEIDTLAMVRRENDRPEPKRSQNVYFSVSKCLRMHSDGTNFSKIFQGQ